MILLYQLLFPAVGLVALAGVAAAGRWGAFREGRADLAERLGLPAWKPRPRTLWVHAASVGEAAALAGLVARAAARPGAPCVVVTANTAAGRAKARSLPGVAAAFLAPMDFLPCVSSFLGRVRPACLLTAESELWPMTLTLARRRGLKVGLANACLSARSGERWLWARGLAAGALAGVSRAAYQSEEDRRRFEALGVPARAGRVCGNPKHDAPLPSPDSLARARERLAELFKGAPVWAAGSTRPGEEELVLEAHAAAAAKVPGLRLILAPRHPERAGDAAALLRKAGLSFARWNEPLPFAAEPQVLLVDAMGALSGLFAAAGAAFVGGSLVPGSGGHNVLEPALLGVPVLFGEHTEAVAAESAALVAAGGARRVAGAAALGEAVAALMSDPAARAKAGAAAKAAALEFSGATEATYAWLEPLLP